mgnify:CR=1 FL=1
MVNCCQLSRAPINEIKFISLLLLCFFVVSHCYFAFTLMGMSNLFLLLHPGIKTQRSPSVEKRIVFLVRSAFHSCKFL